MSDDIRKGWTSASNAAADAACPGRHLAQRGIPEPPKGDDATSGQLIHQALAEYEPASTVAKLTLEQREVYDACREIEKRIVSGYIGATKEQVRVWRHERSWAKVPPSFQHSGEADVIYRCGNRVLIADYKTLAGDVQDSPRNLQLRDLAVLVRGALVTVTEVATLIIQPFVTHSPEVCVYTKEDLDKAQAEMFARIIASNDPNSPRIAGEAQCKYCLAAKAGKCAEYQQWAGAMTAPSLQQLLAVEMSKWTPAQAAAAADALAPAYAFLDQVKAWLKEHVPPGWELAPGNKRETITNPQECFTRFSAKGGTLEQFMACISVGKTRLKEQLHTVTQAKGIALENELKALTVGITEVAHNSPSLRKVDGK